MEPQHPSTKFSYADLELLPEDGLRHEIIDGEHFVSASPVTRHQRISRRLVVAFQVFLDANPLGEVFQAPFDVVMSFHDVVVPDLIYISQSRANQLTSKHLQGAPDLAIEILSPSTRRLDERLKRDLYERKGVEEYWLSAVVTTPLLPGFELRLDNLLH